MKFAIGIKKGMAQIFTEEGRAIPGTVIQAGDLVVTQIKNEKTDGYDAIQVGFGAKNPKNVSKSLVGHMKQALAEKEGSTPFRYLREFRLPAEEIAKFKVGQTIDLSAFALGDKIRVSGLSKGKGFQGVVKRHGFSGGPRSHGQKHSEREPGSIGSTGPQRVFPGKKMAGRMGHDLVTVKNLKVTDINPQTGEIFVSGAVPGSPGTLITITGIK